MPEEKYGDIDVNPIEARSDTKDELTDEQSILFNSGKQSNLSQEDKAEVEKPVAPEDYKVNSLAEPKPSEIPETTELGNLVDSKFPPASENPETSSLEESELPEKQETDQNKQDGIEQGDLNGGMMLSEAKIRKKKTPVIVVSLLAVLGLGGAAFAYYYNLPEKVAADAITGLINDSNKKIQSTGSFELKPRALSSLSDLLTSLKIDFKTATNHFDNNLKFDFNFNLKNGTNIEFSLAAFAAPRPSAPHPETRPSVDRKSVV